MGLVKAGYDCGQVDNEECGGAPLDLPAKDQAAQIPSESLVRTMQPH